MAILIKNGVIVDTFVKNSKMAATFQTLINGEKPVLVDFTATWCGPCKMMKPILEEVKSKIGEKATIIKIDIDESPQAASFYNVQSVPTLILFKGGQVVWRQSGVIPAAQLTGVLESAV